MLTIRPEVEVGWWWLATPACSQTAPNGYCKFTVNLHCTYYMYILYIYIYRSYITVYNHSVICLDNKSWKVVKCQNLVWTYIFLMALRMASDDVIIAQIWMSQLGVNLAWRWYLFRFEISTPADEFDIHRPQAPRPAYLFYRPSLGWDWSGFVEDSGLRATDFAPLGVFNVDPSVCLLEHLWLSCAVAQWGIKLKSAREERYSVDPSVPWCILYPEIWCFLEPQNPNNHVVKCIPKHLSILLGATHLTFCASS